MAHTVKAGFYNAVTEVIDLVKTDERTRDTDEYAEAIMAAARRYGIVATEDVTYRLTWDGQQTFPPRYVETAEEPDREPSAADEEGWTSREDDARGHADV